MNRTRYLILILCLVILICGCSSKPDITSWSDPIILKDDQIITVELPDYANNVLSFTTNGILCFGFSENGANFYYYEFSDGTITFLKSIPKIIFISGDVVASHNDLYFCVREGFDANIVNHWLFFNEQKKTLIEFCTDSYSSPFAYMSAFQDHLVICRQQKEENNRAFSDLEVLDPLTNKRNVVLSYEVNHSEKTGEYFFRPISHDGELVLLGGRYENGELINEFLVLDDAFNVVQRISFPNEGHTDPYEGLFAYSVVNALFNGKYAYLANPGRIGVIFSVSEKGEAKDFFPEMRESFVAFSVQSENQEGRLIVRTDERISKMMRFGIDSDFQPYQALEETQLAAAWQYDDYVLLAYPQIVSSENNLEIEPCYILLPLCMIFQ